MEIQMAYCVFENRFLALQIWDKYEKSTQSKSNLQNFDGEFIQIRDLFYIFWANFYFHLKTICFKSKIFFEISMMINNPKCVTFLMAEN